MMSEHRYILEPYGGRDTRHECPGCGRDREFARYVDTETDQYIADHVGRCNRENRCGYHYTPKQYFEDNGREQEPTEIRKPKPIEAVEPVEYLPLEYLALSYSHYNRNNLYPFLISLYGERVTKHVCSEYLLSSSNYWKGATLFPQIDINGNYRQCKIMLYDPGAGRRVKKGATVQKFNKLTKQYQTIIAEEDCTRIYGKYLDDSTKNLNLQQCYFGEHLLTEHPEKTIAIVESEKTAIIASVYFPSYVWLATGGKYGCKWNNYEVCKVLAGREVILFPDVNAYDKWKERADQIAWQTKAKIHVSDLLEKSATEEQRSGGWDLADYLIKRDESTGLALTAGYPVMFDFEPSKT